MSLKSRLGLLLVCIALGISIAESPLLPPYYEYNISGQFTNAVTGNNANYTLQMFGLPQNMSVVRDWIQCKGMGRNYETPYYVTDSNGYFDIRVNSEFFFDSIKVGIIDPDTIIFGKTVFINESELEQVVTEYRKPESGCNSCSTEPASTIIEKYVYRNYSYSLTIE